MSDQLTQYIMTPGSFSFYLDPAGGETALFGDEHDVSHGMGPHAGTKILVTDYLRQRLDANPGLHVYGEIEPPHPGATNLYPDSSNKELQRLRDLKNSGYRHANRIHNVDDRFASIPDEVYHGNLRNVPEYVRNIVRQLDAPEVLPEIDEVERDEVESGLDSEDETEVLGHLTNPIVDAKMIHILKHNPDRAVDKIFYVGDAHKSRVEDAYLNTAPGWHYIYRRPTQPAHQLPRVRKGPLAFTSLI